MQLVQDLWYCLFHLCQFWPHKFWQSEKNNPHFNISHVLICWVGPFPICFFLCVWRLPHFCRVCFSRCQGQLLIQQFQLLLWLFQFLFSKIHLHEKFMNVILIISASFYGSGSVSLPMQDAQSTTDLTFRFKTSRAESLLVLVAGRTDYCLIMLQAGAIKVSKDNYKIYRHRCLHPGTLSRSFICLERVQSKFKYIWAWMGEKNPIYKYCILAEEREPVEKFLLLVAEVGRRAIHPPIIHNSTFLPLYTQKFILYNAPKN